MHSERTRLRRIVGRIVVEWLIDLIADPRKFIDAFETYRIDYYLIIGGYSGRKER